jgi:uncharacterized small protein (DUF1192 family)
MELYIKTEKPFVEEKVIAKGGKDHIFAGIHVYNDDELNEVRKEFSDAAEAIKLTKWQQELNNLQYSTELSDSEIDEKVALLQEKIEQVLESQRQKLKTFYKAQVTYIKNASLSLKDSDGSVKDIIVKDTREATPLESLWESSEECLAVLLDMYLGSPSFRDSLQKKITSTVFGTNFEDARVKN